MTKIVTEYVGRVVLTVTEEDGKETSSLMIEFLPENSLGKHWKHFIPSIYDLLKTLHIKFSTMNWYK